MNFWQEGINWYGHKLKLRPYKCWTTLFFLRFMLILPPISCHAWLWSIVLVGIYMLSDKNSQAGVSRSRLQGRLIMMIGNDLDQSADLSDHYSGATQHRCTVGAGAGKMVRESRTEQVRVSGCCIVIRMRSREE